MIIELNSTLTTSGLSFSKNGVELGKKTLDRHLADGIYALKDGVSIRIDTFTWGYEGEAPVGASKVIEGKDGTKCLVYGHGTSYVTDGVIWSAE